MTLVLIRHAEAGDREDWEGDDLRRPLDDRGRQQADRLLGLLASYPVGRVVSSPADRCVQTVEPLARARGLAIDVHDELGEELQDTAGASLLRGLVKDAAAVSCHGGLSDALIGESQKKGEAIVLELQDDRLVAIDRVRA